MKIAIFYFIYLSFMLGTDFFINQSFGKIIKDDVELNEPFLGGFNKPKIQWLDWNNDGLEDLFLLDEDSQLKLYVSNNCNLDIPCLDLYSTEFLGIKNILWFYIYDFDNDHELEIITSDPLNTQYVKYYNLNGHLLIDEGNIMNDQGQLVEIDPVMTPSFSDIDNDGDLDLFSGNVVGTVNFFENLDLVDNIPVFNVADNFWQSIYIVGSSFNQRHGASAINFIDLDNDGDLDLSWGDFFQQSLYIIWNIGTVSNPIMDNVNILTQFPVNDPIITAGLNMPTFTDIDNDGDMDLFITTLSGAYGYQLSNNFSFYEKEGNSFIYKTSNFIETLDLLSDINLKFVDIDNDNDLDLFVGTDFDPSSFPWRGKILFFRNLGLSPDNQEPIWEQETTDLLNQNIGNNLFPEFVDIDNDSDLDLFVGEFNGLLHYFRNEGTIYQHDFEYAGEVGEIDLAGYSTPEFVDIDNDDDYDLLLGDINGNIFIYHNIGDKSNFMFSENNHLIESINVGSRATILSIDYDYDNDFDLLVGSGSNNIIYYQNTGNNVYPNFILNEDVTFPSLGLNISIDFFSSCFDAGLIIGTSTGGAYFLSQQIVSGDLNLDDNVDIFDLVLLVELILENNQCEFKADINKDGNLDINDLLSLIQIVLNR